MVNGLVISHMRAIQTFEIEGIQRLADQLIGTRRLRLARHDVVDARIEQLVEHGARRRSPSVMMPTNMPPASVMPTPTFRADFIPS
jgi:hypothetical protein